MNPLHLRLASLRRRLRIVVTFRGACWLVSVVLLACALAGLLDWSAPGHLPPLVRAVLLVGTLAAAGLVTYRALFRPLAARTDDLSLALRVEDLNPGLNDSLASALQFLEQSRRGGGSTSLDSSIIRLEAVKRAMRQLDKVDFHKAVNTRGVGSAGLSFVVASAVAVALIVANPVLALTALERLALPFGGKDWPRQTQIEDVQFRARVASGQPYVVQARLSGVVPDSAFILYEGITPSRQRCERRRPREGNGADLAARLDRVDHSFRFKLEANDAATPWYEVIVSPPPLLVPLDGRASPQVTLQFPAYTDLGPKELDDGNGNVEAVVGTRVVFKAAVDRPVARAWIEYQPQQPLVYLAANLGFLGARDGSALITQASAAHLVAAPVPVRLDPSGHVLSVEFVPVVRGAYVLHFEDDTGLGNARAFELKLLPDPAPTVVLKRPSATRERLSLLPEADVHVRVTAQDPQFAVRSAFLTYRCRRPGTDPGPVRRLPLYDHASTGVALSRVMAPFAGPLSLPVPPLRLRLGDVQVAFRIPVAAFKHPDEGELRDGDVITLQAGADDFDDVSVFKEPGASAEVELFIVNAKRLDAELNRAQTQIQEELLRLRKEQQEALDRVVGPQQRWKNTGKLSEADENQLLQAQEMQQQIRARIGDKKEGLRAEVNRLLQSLRDNKLRRSGVHDRMEAVASELDRLAREHLDQIEPKLANALKENRSAREPRDPPKDDKGALSQAKRHQEEVEKTLNELLRQLEPWGDVNSVKGEARELLKEQRKLLEEVQKLEDDGALGANKLTPEQKAARDRIAELQRKVEERTGQLLDKIRRAEEARREKDPELAAALKQALNKGEPGSKDPKNKGQAGPEDPKGVRQSMQDAGQKVRDNHLGPAAKDQKAAAKALEEMINALDERREEQLDRLRKKLEEAQNKLDDLAQKQDELRKKTKEARQIADPKERAQQLKKLAEQQDRLKKETEELVRELKRLRADRAARALAGAGGDMERAGKKLQQNEADAENQQEEALTRLNEARERLDQEQDKVEEELTREKLAKVAEQIKGLKERQEALLAEGDRLRARALREKTWARGALFSLNDLADAQQALGKETAALAEGKLKGAHVFARILARAAQAMDEAAVRMKHVRANPKEHLTDAESSRLQREALRRLDQLLDSLKPGAAAAKPQQEGEGGGQGGQGGAGSRAPQDGIPHVAQLKALRALQKEVNERTETFGKEHPDLKKLSSTEEQELAGIRKDQKDVAGLLEDLTAPADEPEGEKK